MKEFKTGKLLVQDCQKIVDILKKTDVKKLTVEVTKHDDGTASITFSQETFPEYYDIENEEEEDLLSYDNLP